MNPPGPCIQTLADTLGAISSGWGASGIFSGGLYSAYARPDAFSVAATAAASIAASAKAFFGGLSIKALVTSAAAALGPVGLAILAGTVLVGVGLWIYKANKNKNDSKGNSKSGNPPVTGKPNSYQDKKDGDGKTIRRRYYGPDGKAEKDIDFTDHGNPKNHPKVPHEHDWDWSNPSNPRGSWR